MQKNLNGQRGKKEVPKKGRCVLILLDYFKLLLRQSCIGVIRRVRSEQKTFQKTSTITRPLEDVLSSTDLETEVSHMLICAAHNGFTR
ncbi:hypothetical protein QJS10_CPA08g00565 [Acorus calamus]|uniref:Uncharacterized protein n=1 Tax=Acorus calamus TaxID=4465 RepID=A0AAV9E8V7_ACOCL|nr:hypothetical protein QJS10_CPA08g00565 [Acorus calamus]